MPELLSCEQIAANDVLAKRLDNLKRTKRRLYPTFASIACVGAIVSCLCARLGIAITLIYTGLATAFGGLLVAAIVDNMVIRKREFSVLCELGKAGDIRAIVPSIDLISECDGASADYSNTLGDSVSCILGSLDNSSASVLGETQLKSLRSILHQYPSGPWEGAGRRSDQFTLAIVKVLTSFRDTASLSAIKRVAERAEDVILRNAASRAVMELEQDLETRQTLLRGSVEHGDERQLLRSTVE